MRISDWSSDVCSSDLVFDREKVAIREVTLPQVRWQEYAMKGFDSYRETLYILHSPQDVLNTRLDEIRFEIEELNFDLDALATDPERVIRLDDERRRLIKQKDISKIGRASCRERVCQYV